MDKATSVAIKALKEISSPVNGKEDIARVASISANNNEIGQYSIQEKDVQDFLKNLAEFRYELYKHKVGEEIEITYYRNGKVSKTKIKLSSGK